MPESATRKTGNKWGQDFRSKALADFYRSAADELGPKRNKLYHAMLKMIEQGFWYPGDRLPTDIEFTEFLPLSLATVQAALKLLAEQEILVRKKKQGTFVASEDHLSRDLVFFRFVKPGSSALLDIKDVNYSVEETGDQGPWGDYLGQRDRYIRLNRTLEIEGEFRVRSEWYFANPRLRVLLDFQPESLQGIAVRTLLHLRFGLPTLGLEWQSSFETFDTNLAHELAVAQAVTGQRYDIRIRTIGDEPLSFHRFWIPPNDYTLLI